LLRRTFAKPKNEVLNGIFIQADAAELGTCPLVLMCPKFALHVPPVPTYA
jgi:hypothetical protein